MRKHMPVKALLRTWSVVKTVPRTYDTKHNKNQQSVNYFNKAKNLRVSGGSFWYHTTKSSTEHTFLREWPREKDFTTEFEDLIESLDNPRIRLYPSIYPVHDPVLEEIVQAETVDQVFSLLEKNPVNINHSTQALVTLWTLQKSYSNWKTTFGHAHLLDSLKTFLPAVKSHSTFQRLISHVNENSLELPDDVLTTAMLCFRRFQIPPWDLEVYNVLLVSLEKINGFSLPALSKWCLAVATYNHAGRLILPSALPALEKHIEACQSAEDLKPLSLCFSIVAPLVDNLGPTAKSYVQKISDLIHNGIVNSETPVSTLVKILNGLYITAKGNAASSATSLKILHLLVDSRELEDTSNGIYFNMIRKSWEAIGEPIELIRRVEALACRWLEDVDIRIHHLDILNHVSYFASDDRKRRLEFHLLRIMTEESPSSLEPYLRQIFRIIRSSKISDPEIVDTFWQIISECLKLRSDGNDEFLPFLHDAIIWYMFFNNNLGGTYRSRGFEAQVLGLINLVVGENWERPVINVRSFCRLSAFALAYGTYPFPKRLLAKLCAMEGQISSQDIFYLSRGIQLGRHWLRRQDLIQSHSDLADLTMMLDRRTMHLVTRNLNAPLNETTNLLQASKSRHGQAVLIKDAKVVHETSLRKCESQLDEMNSRLARDIILFIGRYRYSPFPILDHMIKYALERHEHMTPSVLVGLLIVCFELGYCPSTIDALGPIVAKSLDMQSSRTYGLSILECALALMLPNQLPHEVVNEIFTVKFLDRLDTEVEACYSKASYPSRVRRALMELNRCVCIEMPECGVPWFHEKYCQELFHSHSPATTSFHNDIYRNLKLVLGNSHSLKLSTYSPYYHHIDFEIEPSSVTGQPASSAIFGSNLKSERIAILAWLPSSYTAGYTNLTGIVQLHKRQMEILGYKVVGIPYHHWNSLALSSSEAKCNYLRRKLFP